MTLLQFAESRTAIVLLTLVVLVGYASPSSAQRFLPDDPLMVDPDRQDVPIPEANEPSDYWDFVEQTFVLPADYSGPALNVNTLGDVPNSSWYTRRHYWNPMSADELRRGPDAHEGPSQEGKWTVVGGKAEGKSAGFQIVDARGDRYFLKFDPANFTEISTSAEEIATKFFYALGYHVPENNVVRFRADRLVPDDEESLSAEQIDAILDRAPRYEDGSYRALASLFVAGEEILGPFRYFGTRPDDANDIFPHESRRELRGMRLFAAWLNHDDSRSINSLDVVKKYGDSTFVEHYLLDFGTTFGGGPRGPKERWIGYQYAIDPAPILLRTVSLGFLGSDWIGYEYPGYPLIGHYTARYFDPTEWKPQYPNPAFSRMDIEDAFWAAKQIMSFSDEDIRAIVSTGEYSNKAAASYLAEAIAERRDIIGETYLWLGGGLDKFRVEGRAVVFEDLLARHGLISEPVRRSIEWRSYDNRQEAAGPVIDSETMTGTEIEIPNGTDAEFLQTDVRTRDYGRTRIWLREDGGGYEVVGIDRSWGEGLPDLEAAEPEYLNE